jgi:hypothetical protein
LFPALIVADAGGPGVTVRAAGLEERFPTVAEMLALPVGPGEVTNPVDETVATPGAELL